MSQASWYLIGYDVRQPSRLKRVHRLLKDEAIAAQKSLFIFHGTATERAALQTRLQKLIKQNEDDIRIYPIGHPERLWLSGVIPAIVAASRCGGATADKTSWWQRMAAACRLSNKKGNDHE